MPVIEQFPSYCEQGTPLSFVKTRGFLCVHLSPWPQEDKWLVLDSEAVAWGLWRQLPSQQGLIPTANLLFCSTPNSPAFYIKPKLQEGPAFILGSSSR